MTTSNTIELTMDDAVRSSAQHIFANMGMTESEAIQNFYEQSCTKAPCRQSTVFQTLKPSRRCAKQKPDTCKRQPALQSSCGCLMKTIEWTSKFKSDFKRISRQPRYHKIRIVLAATGDLLAAGEPLSRDFGPCSQKRLDRSSRMSSLSKPASHLQTCPAGRALVHSSRLPQ